MEFSKFNTIAFPDGEQTDSFLDVATHEVDPVLVGGCIEAYHLKAKAGDTKLCAGVSFLRDDLTGWFSKNVSTDYDRIDILFGIYTESFVLRYTQKANELGCVSVFIGLFKGDKPAEINGNTAPLYNIGDLKPPTWQFI